MPASRLRSTRTQRKRDERIQKILHTAEKIIVKENLDSLTIHRLAKKLDYAPGALYRYFSSKEVLLTELSCRAIDRIHEKLVYVRDAPISSELTPPQASVARILTIANLYCNLHIDDPATFCLLGSLLGDPRKLLDDNQAELVHERTVPVLISLSSLIEEAMDCHAIGPGNATERAISFWAGLQGVTQLRKLLRHPTNLKEMLDPDRLGMRLITDLLVGWGASQSFIEEVQSKLRES